MRDRVAVAASAIVAHLTALGAGFVWLDHAHIEGGLAIAPPSKMLSLFGQGFAGTGYYRPLMALSLSLDALVGGPFVFHLTSIAWHAAAALLVAIAAETLGLTRRAATIAGILFAVHPVTSLVADAIAFRSEAIVTVALLTLIWAHLRGRRSTAVLAIVAGAFSKEIAIPLAPAFIAALELSRRTAGSRQLPTKLLATEALALAGAIGVRTAFAPPFRATHPDLGAGDAIGTRLAALAKSVAAVAVPVNRTICDAFAVTHVWHPTALVGALALGAFAYGAWRRRGPALLLAFALLPALQLAPVMRWWSPHYLYLPLAFVAMLAGELVERSGRRTFIAAGAIGVVLAGLSLLDGRRYASDAALWTPEIAAQPACREGQFFLGDVARAEQRWDLAAKRYDAALQPWPGILAYVDHAAALQNLGITRVEQKRFGDARAVFRRALEGTRNEQARRELTHDLAAATLSDGDPAEAARLLEEETARPDALPQSLFVRMLALRRLGREDEARALGERLPKRP